MRDQGRERNRRINRATAKKQRLINSIKGYCANHKKKILALAALHLVPLVYAADYADTPFETREKRAEAIARNLRVDGDSRDWGDYPARSSTAQIRPIKPQFRTL